MSQVTEEDKLLFKRAIEGVNPLTKRKKVEVTPPKLKPKPTHKMQKNLGDSIERPDFELTDPVTAHETLLDYRKGLRIQDLSRLRKGEFTLQGRLDLHGYTEEAAEQRLVQFIQQGYARKYRYLLIVHGKGYNSDMAYPILKNLVNRLLRNLPQVVAFCSATQKDGGVGAVYVLIKAH